jgi:hypothetical protein
MRATSRACAVIAIIIVCRCSPSHRRISAAVAYPSISGISQSSSTTEYCERDHASIAALPPPTRSTRYPRVSISSSEIRQLLDNIRSSAVPPLRRIQDGSKAVEAGVREFAEAAVLFRQIAALVSTASEAAREIELSTEQQASAVDQVRMGASNLVQTAHETDTSSKQLLQTSSELAGLSRELVLMVRSNGSHVDSGRLPT